MFGQQAPPSLAHNLQPVLLARVVVLLEILFVREVFQISLMFGIGIIRDHALVAVLRVADRLLFLAFLLVVSLELVDHDLDQALLLGLFDGLLLLLVRQYYVILALHLRYIS